MPTAPEDFLHTSSLLLGVGLREADYRSSISRAYYAAFSLVKIRSQGIVSYVGTGEHKLAQDFLKAHWGDLSRDFMRLQDRRIEADYDLSCAVTKDRAIYVNTLARRFLAELRTR